MSRIALILASVTLAGTALALDSDRDQPISIEADEAIIDENAGISTYSGNVNVHQGTLHIAADEVEIHSINDEVTQIVASVPDDAERLAHYEQKPEDDELVSADARTITYFIKDERFHLVGDAQLTQGQDTFTGEVIHYEARERRVKSEGGIKTVFKPGQRRESPE